MSRLNDAGPAFPFAATDPSNVPMQAQGMTLRDWFAGQALSICHTCFEKGANPDSYDLATYVYFIADAMLIARNEE